MFENINLIEWIGYVGSVIIAISLTMSSIIRLRWLNLMGASIFSTYGFIIGSMPVAFLNLFITLINIFYLTRIYSAKDYFKILHIRKENRYLQYFLDFYSKDINKFFPGFCNNFKNHLYENENLLCILIIRNANVAGLFIGRKVNDDEMFIEIDFAIPEYRDFKTGDYVYRQNLEHFLEMGIKKLITEGKNKKHHHYLKKMGFTEQPGTDGKVTMIKLLQDQK
ncbi:MAG: YgjV family protein [Bacteroidales bacterium]|nr:YgjV family protein [Bacteroidales bacterium]